MTEIRNDFEFENITKWQDADLIFLGREYLAGRPFDFSEIIGTPRNPKAMPHLLQQHRTWDRMQYRYVEGVLEILLLGLTTRRLTYHDDSVVLSTPTPKQHKKNVVPIIRSLSEQRLAARFITVLRRTTMTYKGLYTTFSQTHGLTCNSAKSYITRAVNVGIIHKTGDGYSMA